MPTESVTKLPVRGEEGKGKEKEAMTEEDLMCYNSVQRRR